MDHLFGEAPTRETDEAGYLIRMRNQNLVVKKGGYTRTRVRVLVIDHPSTWSLRSRQDKQVLCPTRF